MTKLGVGRILAPFLLIAFANTAASQTVVVPNAFENTEAPSSNSIPLGTALFCDNGIRYQQVYADAELTESGLISAVRFRLDGSILDPLPSTVYGGTSISVSTAANGPDTFSNTFADNTGADVVEVFSGDLTLSAPGSAAAPKPFDVEIGFQTPFNYTGGDLLLDISINVCGNPGVFFDRGDDASLTRRITARDVDAASGNTGTGAGLVTQFQFESSAPPQAIPLFGKIPAGPVLLIALILIFGFWIPRRPGG